jgi:hypothetical protein
MRHAGGRRRRPAIIFKPPAVTAGDFGKILCFSPYKIKNREADGRPAIFWPRGQPAMIFGRISHPCSVAQFFFTKVVPLFFAVDSYF